MNTKDLDRALYGPPAVAPLSLRDEVALRFLLVEYGGVLPERVHAQALVVMPGLAPTRAYIAADAFLAEREGQGRNGDDPAEDRDAPAYMAKFGVGAERWYVRVTPPDDGGAGSWVARRGRKGCDLTRAEGFMVSATAEDLMSRVELAMGHPVNGWLRESPS